MIVLYGETRISDIKDDIINNIDSESFKVNDYTIKLFKCLSSEPVQKAGKRSRNTSRNTKPLIVEYDKLPELILTEFTNLTNGLLSNFALSAITTIRK